MIRNTQELGDLIKAEFDALEIEKSPKNLYDPIGYILSIGGKRLRPLITLLSHQLFNDDPIPALKPAIGAEVFHNFTLMHDDIMDNAPLRRGKKTVHELWNPNIAILSGDVMFVKSFELVMEVDDSIWRSTFNAFNQCAKGVCEGQQIDMDFEQRDDVSVDEYIQMIRLKTATLIGFCLELGALVGGASKEDVQNLRDFGLNLGIGFQLMDDLLDVYGDDTKFGKQKGGDIIANKKTYLWIEAYDSAEGELLDRLNFWANQKEFEASKKVEEVTSIYDSLGIRQRTESLMNQYFEAAFKNLNALAIDKDRMDPMIDFTNNLIKRDH